MTRDVSRFRDAEARLWRSVGVTPTERFVELRSGGNVRVQEIGSGPSVLFVHGVSVAGSTWCGLAAALSDFHCILLDRPGCGLSDPNPTGQLTNLSAVLASADDLIRNVLDALEIGRANIAATSYGGLFALRGAAAHPDRVDRLVEYSWPMGAPMSRIAMSMRMAALPGMQALPAKLPVTPRVVKAMLSGVGLKRAIRTGTFTDEMVDWTVSVMRDTDTLANDMRASPTLVTPIRGLNRDVLLSDETLAKVESPALFLWGDEDTNGGEDVAREFVPRFPNAHLEMIREAGHAPWIDELDLCVSATREFLTA